jgi:hypothetical protein
MTDTNTGKKLLKFASLTILFLIIIFYGIWKGRDLIFGIHLTINGIQNNETVTHPVLELSGNAYHAVSITINGRIVSIEEDGAWHDIIALLNGYNVINISAKDKFGRIITKEFTVNYKEPPGITPSTTDIPPGKKSSSSAT